MNSILVKALLSSCTDLDSVFTALSWGRGARPQTPQVEALTAFIQGLRSVPAAASSVNPGASVERVVWAQCLPLLFSDSAERDDAVESKESVFAACGLLRACLPLCEEATRRRVAEHVLPHLERDPDVASEVLVVVLPEICAHEELTGKVLDRALTCVKTLPDDAQVCGAGVRLLRQVLVCSSGDRLSSLCRSVLDELSCWHRSEGTSAVTGRTLLCLTPLFEHLVKSLASDPRLFTQIWRVVQDGLTHKDCVTRKRALYVLKRSVALCREEGVCCQSIEEDEALFSWDSDHREVLGRFWDDFCLVMETLEENQIHVVRPVLNRIDTLTQTINDTKGRRLVHPSWLLCVFQRMFHSENKALMREGVCHLLQLHIFHQPHFASSFSQFVVGPFLDVLSETSLFQRADGQSAGDCPELAVKLQLFICDFFNNLPPEEKASVLLQLIQRLASRQWSAVPVLFMSQALSSLSPCPLLGHDGLVALREVLGCALITHQVLLRGAAQCFLLNSALCLTNVSAVTLDDVFVFLMHFRSDESLCRGTKLWHQVCVWLRSNEEKFKSNPNKDYNQKSVKDYVQHELVEYLKVPPCTGESERLPEVNEAVKMARVILLCVDMELGQTEVDISNTLESFLSPLLDTLSRVSTNVYLPLKKSDKSLQLMLHLLLLKGATQDNDQTQEDHVFAALKNLFLKVVEPVLEFIVRQLCGQLQELVDIDRADMYLQVLKQLLVLCRAAPSLYAQFQQTYLPKLTRFSLRVLEEPSQQNPSVQVQTGRVVAMASLASLCSLLKQRVIDVQSVSELRTLNEHFYNTVDFTSKSLRKPSALEELKDTEGRGGTRQDWGRVSAQYLSDRWLCLSVLLGVLGIPESVRPQSSVLLQALVRSATEGLSVLPSNRALPVFSFLETSLPLLAELDEALCVEPLTVSWDLVQGLGSNPLDFWPSLRAFLSVAFHQELLVLTEAQAPNLTTTIKTIASELMELSQSKSGVFGLLVQHCCQIWRQTGHNSPFASVFTHIHILIEACVHGPVLRRDQRLIQDVHTFVEKLGEDCAANVVLCCEDRDEQLPRSCVLSFLTRLHPNDSLHQELMQNLALELMKKDRHISCSKVRYYNNSMQHRVKNRIWQTLLVLLPKLSEDFVSTMLSSVYEAGFCSNQASVKYLIEWTMILILNKFPRHISSFWDCFNLDHEKTKVSICTFLSVLVHFDVILQNVKDQVGHLRKALEVILQCCFNHNFSVRLYALLALKRVWSLAEDRAAEGLHSLSSVIRTCLSQAEALQSTGNANKNWIKIQEHFFFGAFHPVRDYSLETILYIFPSLSELSDDEWIPPEKFTKLPCYSPNPTCPLINPTSHLREIHPGHWTQQDKSEEQEKEERWAEVQKKITPWRLDLQEHELQLVPQQRAARVGKQHGALLVVASLIDKATNLGGLCRTCEIFGASALVLDSLRHVNDKQFQSLSVTSERWLPLLEVKPVELTDFLQQKKTDGYCIVGVEQTANSHSLESYHFPQKTLLLLGNEREGIPANLLQLLDVCVEIPQLGVVRSLNVHVSAALLIWEYTRQHLLTATDSSRTT